VPAFDEEENLTSRYVTLQDYDNSTRFLPLSFSPKGERLFCSFPLGGRLGRGLIGNKYNQS